MSKGPNWRAIGNAFVKKCIKDLLEPTGFRCHEFKRRLVVIGPGKIISKEEDLWGCIDVEAIHPQLPFTCYFQMTVGGYEAGRVRRHKVMDCKHWNPVGHRVFVWQRDSEHKQVVHSYQLLVDDDVSGWREWEFSFNELSPEGLLEYIKGAILK